MKFRLQTPFSSHDRFQIVFGARCSLIYDLKLGKAYHVNGAATQILKKIIKKPAKNLKEVLPHNLFHELIKYQFLGDDGSLNNETISIGPLPEKPFKKIWVELTNRCNQKCVHCYATASPKASEGLKTEIIQTFLKNVFTLGCEALQFTGGEPFLREDLPLLIDFSKRNNVREIELFSNLSTNNRSSLEKIAKYEIIISTTILAADAITHDRLTNLPGSFNRMISNIKFLQDSGISVNASIILMSETENQYEDIMKFCKDMKLHFGEPDSVRPFGRGRNKNIKCKKIHNVRDAPFFESTPRSFLYSKHYNSCWGNMLFLRFDGKVVPCPHARDLILGDIITDNFEDILDGAISQAWTLTLDDVETCKECEFKYICTDCRPLAFEENINNILQKNSRCLYDPFSGQWKKIPNQIK
ncbi:MAG: radical SAM protein [Gammaproteobacteria bacterium]|nr:radical SAM protein [Gammaproteobacteria bacterium]